MKCNLHKINGTVYACANIGCGRILKIERAKPSKVLLPCRGTCPSNVVPDDVSSLALDIASREVIDLSGPPHGPGAEFRKLAEERGVNQGGCQCKATEARMNRLGPDGCRRDMESLIDEVLKNSRGKVLFLSRDMVRWTIEEACRIAEATAPQTTESPAA